MELGCRFSPTSEILPPAVFQSLACAHCLFYIYFVTPPYSSNYKTKFCDARGLLICPRFAASTPALMDDGGGGGDAPVYSNNTNALYDRESANSTRLLTEAEGKLEAQLRSERQMCTCENYPSQIYNHPKFAINRTTNSIEALKLAPNLPADFALIVGQCCEAAAKCCNNVLLRDRDSSPSFTFTKRHMTVMYRSAKRAISRGNHNVTTNANDDNGVNGSAQKKNERLTLDNSISAMCPATWDGWHCFERSEPGELQATCPNYIFGDRIRNDIDGLVAVRKNCLHNGEWYTVARGTDASAAEWTDYSGCVSNKAYTLKLFAGLLAFSVTVITIIPAIFIFSLHRSLRNQPMFVIHRQLLYSFLFSGVFYIFNSLFFVIDGAPGDHLYFMNHLSCRLLFTIQLRYFRLSTFSWMLGEGVYLYRLLMCTFSSGIEALQPYFITCWGLPLVITTVYSFLRETFDNEECWITPTKFWLIEWTIIGPCLIALSINLLLMLVIFCVLLKKLRCNPNLEPAQYTKAVRAVFMLVPVFGLHFLITIYRIQSYLHQVINLVLDGLQGFVVVLIVCYTNRTVIESVRTWIQQKREEQSLRRQSEDHKMRFQRSIQERKTSDPSSRARLSRQLSQPQHRKTSLQRPKSGSGGSVLQRERGASQSNGETTSS